MNASKLRCNIEKCDTSQKIIKNQKVNNLRSDYNKLERVNSLNILSFTNQ